MIDDERTMFGFMMWVMMDDQQFGFMMVVNFACPTVWFHDSGISMLDVQLFGIKWWYSKWCMASCFVEKMVEEG